MDVLDALMSFRNASFDELHIMEQKRKKTMIKIQLTSSRIVFSFVGESFATIEPIETTQDCQYLCGVRNKKDPNRVWING